MTASTDKIYKILLFMQRRPGMSLAAFRDYYENHHVPLSLKYAAGIQRYVRRYLEPHPRAETGDGKDLGYDVITELWFDDEKIFNGTVKYLSTALMPEEVIEDEKALFDRSTIRLATVTENITMPGES
jgi:hypothetical protein